MKQSSYFLFGLFFLLYGCNKNEPALDIKGAYEAKWESDERLLKTYYVCYVGEENEPSAAGVFSITHTDKSCADLGYTKGRSVEGKYYYTSPEGKEVPGENGYFYKEWSEDENDNSDDNGSGSGETYDWTYECSGNYGGGGTVPITKGPCEASQKKFAKVFGCNEVDNMYQACKDWYGCMGQNTTICDAYK